MQPQTNPHIPTFKILCLHGIGTNSDIFESQTALLRHELSSELVEYEFVEGAYPWPAAPGIKEVFGEQQTCYSYVDGTAQGAMSAVNDLAEYVEENGPFDAVMGFSLGADLAATLLLRPERYGQVAVRSAIFLSAGSPCDWHALEKGVLTFLEAKGSESTIRIPTIHSWSPADVHNVGRSQQLFEMCDDETRTQVRHGAGHSIPARRDEVIALATAIKRMLASLYVRDE